MDMSRSAEKLAEYVGIAAVQGRVFQMVIQVIIFQAHIASILTMHHLNYIEIIQDSWEGQPQTSIEVERLEYTFS